MEAVLQLLKDNFKTFGIEAINLALVCAAILFWIVEQEKLEKRVGKFMKYEISLFILIANPFGYNAISTFWVQEEYWKVFLLLLPGVCIATSLVEIVAGAEKVWQRAVVAIACVGIVAASMNFSVVGDKLAIPENSSKVASEIIEVDQVIRETGIMTENMIAPREVCAQIREIDEGVELLYGEDLIERMIDKTAVSEDEEEQLFIDVCTTIVAVPEAVDYQVMVADMYGSNCILLENSYDDAEVMESAGFACYGRTEKYAVYYRN